VFGEEVGTIHGALDFAQGYLLGLQSSLHIELTDFKVSEFGTWSNALGSLHADELSVYRRGFPLLAKISGDQLLEEDSFPSCP